MLTWLTLEIFNMRLPREDTAVTDELLKYRTSEKEPPNWFPSEIAGPAIGFALTAILVVSFVLAFAGGIGIAAPSSHDVIFAL